jgi:hypothetical protein
MQQNRFAAGMELGTLSALRPTLLRRLPMRFSCDPPRDRAGVCFCRMCQKASGQPFVAFVRFRADQVHWSKPPDIFKSSNMVERGFSAACGTPLTWRRIDGPYISLTLNSLDHPERVLPEMRFSAGSAPAWCHALADLPTREMDLSGWGLTHVARRKQTPPGR